MAAQLPLEDDAWWAAQTSPDGPHAGKAWWGWGLASELRAEIRAQGKKYGYRLLRPPTVAEAARALPQPRLLPEDLPAPLRAICTAAPFERLLHARGRDMVDVIRNVRGEVGPAHDLVAYPEDEGQLLALLSECERRKVAVVPFGGGSSVVGGVAPPPSAAEFAACIAVDLAKMGRVLEVDEASQCARVQAGVFGPELEKQLRPSGLTLRHFPQSFEFSALGGWLATRGGGHFATGPTHVDEMVQSLRVASPAGLTETRRLPGSGAGPAEHRLYLGSEGSLGIITEAWLKLRRRPACRASATVLFLAEGADTAFEQGTQALRALAQTGLLPANLRLVYGPEVARTGSLREEEAAALTAGAVLLLGLESPMQGAAGAKVLDAELEALLEVAAAEGGSVLSKKKAGEAQGGEREGVAGSWGKGFMRGGYLSSASCLLSSMIYNTIETACTWRAFPELHKAVLSTARAAVRQHCGVEGEVTCRVTHVYPDGPAPYYTIVAKGLPEGEDRRIEMWLGIKRAVMDAIMEHGGTSTHHHAVGRLHQEHYEMESGKLWPGSLAAAKAVHDPSGIMNPGMLLGPRAKL